MTGLLVVGLAGGAVGQDRTPSAPADSRPEPAPEEAEPGRCKPPPAKAKIKVNVKPDTEVADVIAWYSALTCTPLVVSSDVPTAGKKVTILSPRQITRKELDDLFLGALDAVGLTIERDGRFFFVIETAKTRHSNTPVDLGR
jgi:type II secretory pathway component GspD/PulD (secretin)